jgi:hypothetical protein
MLIDWYYKLKWQWNNCVKRRHQSHRIRDIFNENDNDLVSIYCVADGNDNPLICPFWLQKDIIRCGCIRYRYMTRYWHSFDSSEDNITPQFREKIIALQKTHELISIYELKQLLLNNEVK